MKVKNMFRRVLSILLALLMLCSVCVVGVSALQPEEGIMPLWDSIHYMDMTLTFCDGEGIVGASAARKPTASSIEGTITVYEYVDGEWEYVDSWYKKVTRGSLGMEVYFPAVSGVVYRAVFTVTAYTDNVPESHTTSTSKTCP